MSDKVTSVWKDEKAQQLTKALALITDTRAMQNFMSDVLTEKEITEISARLEAARMLQAGERYVDIVAATNLSSRTVARISDWLQNGTGGYKATLALLGHHDHLSPARAE